MTLASAGIKGVVVLMLTIFPPIQDGKLHSTGPAYPIATAMTTIPDGQNTPLTPEVCVQAGPTFEATFEKKFPGSKVRWACFNVSREDD